MTHPFPEPVNLSYPDCLFFFQKSKPCIELGNKRSRVSAWSSLAYFSLGVSLQVYNTRLGQMFQTLKK